MATAVLIPVKEYLRASDGPDADFVDGQIEERHVGQPDHSDIQKRLLELLSTGDARTYFRVNPELRFKVSARRYRVPESACVAPAPRASRSSSPRRCCASRCSHPRTR